MPKMETLQDLREYINAIGWIRTWCGELWQVQPNLSPAAKKAFDELDELHDAQRLFSKNPRPVRNADNEVLRPYIRAKVLLVIKKYEDNLIWEKLSADII